MSHSQDWNNDKAVAAAANANKHSRRMQNSSAASKEKAMATPPTSPRKSNARPRPSNSEFDRGKDGRKPAGRDLWKPADVQSQPQPPSQRHAAPRRGHTAQAATSKPHTTEAPPSSTVEEGGPAGSLFRQPSASIISQDQLISEVKGIYAGLVMVESKCIEVANVQSVYKSSAATLTSEQWQALIALHRTLLHEHHDFFLASQHPSAGESLQRLANKYAMPARMWRHGIHSFLELLRLKLPESLDFMLCFIYLAYTNTALLYETIPAFEDTWIECLGDLARYRMAIEDEDIRDRETWTGVARGWYLKASNRLPRTGRLYHHLAILARPNALQQLFYYAKSFCVATPFPSARESIMTLFEPVFSYKAPHLLDIDAEFITVHGVLFCGQHKERLAPSMDKFIQLLPDRINQAGRDWLEIGYVAMAATCFLFLLTCFNRYHVGIALTCSLLGYGEPSNMLMKIIAKPPSDVTSEESTAEPEATQRSSPETFSYALDFTIRIFKVIIDRKDDASVLPFLHTIFTFLHCMSGYEEALAPFETKFPWDLTADFLNSLLQQCVKDEFKPRLDTAVFPGPFANEKKKRPLPEDFAMRGLLFSETYHPPEWFEEHGMEEDEKYFELPSMAMLRRERILWISKRIASKSNRLAWDDTNGRFLIPGAA